MLPLFLFPSVQNDAAAHIQGGPCPLLIHSANALSHTRRCRSLMFWPRNHDKPFATFYSESCGAKTHWELRLGALSA